MTRAAGAGADGDNAAMTEIELRFQIPASQLAAVRRWVTGDARQPARRERLQAAYFDTPERDLARAGFALRLRREGRRWVQTLKGAAPDGMSRLEHNVALGSGAAMPALEVARHAGHPAGEALLALVAQLPAGALQALFRTDIRRSSRALRTRHGEVELALDEGALLAGEGEDLRQSAVAELEIELKRGRPQAVLEVAQRWALGRFGLSLELRTKALRGDLLARRQSMAPVRQAELPMWPREATPAQALQALLRASVEPILGNASQLIAGPQQPEHLHQLRVALRQLRVGLRLLRGEDERAALGADEVANEGAALPLRGLEAGAAELARALAPLRDAQVLAQATWREPLAQAWQAQGQPLAALTWPEPPQPAAGELLARREAQAWMLALLALLAQAPADVPSDAAPLQTEALLARWARRLARDIARWPQLDVAGRHALRRDLRRQRLALALRGPDKGGRAAHARLLRRLQRAQQALGELNDLELALARCRAALSQPEQAGAAGFALGFLLPRQAKLLARAQRRLVKLG